MFQSREDKRHVSEQRLPGCGQRPWDHHLEDRGELGWKGLLKAPHTESPASGSAAVRGRAENMASYPCTERAGELEEMLFTLGAGLQAKISWPFIQPSALPVNALERWVGPGPPREPQDYWLL